MDTNAASLHVSYAERNLAYWRRNLAVCVFGSFTTPDALPAALDRAMKPGALAQQRHRPGEHSAGRCLTHWKNSHRGV